MPPVMVDVRSSDDVRDVVHQAVQALTEGKLVAFPTETVYGVAASALCEDAVSRLIDLKGRKQGSPLALAVKSDAEAIDYVLDLSPLGRRLVRRCWPGPVTLVLPAEHPESLLGRLPESVRQAVSPNGSIGLRVPAHLLILDVLDLLVGPLVLSSANRKGQPDPVSAQQVVDELGDDIDMVLDDGRCQFGQSSSVVRVQENELEILRSGVVDRASLQWLSGLMVLIVCTGNTCRSPMAEILLRKRIADKLGCKLDELPSRGIRIASAGIAAMVGGRPTPEAVQVMARRGLNLSEHESQPVTDRLMRHADVILTMTRSHYEMVVRQWPEAASRVEVFCRNGEDVPDPIGGPVEMYNRCADQMVQQLDPLVESWDLSCPKII